MRARLHVSLLAAVGVLLAACQPDRGTEHSVPQFQAGGAIACNFGALPDFARLYLGSGDLGTAMNLIRQMSTQAGAGDPVGATSTGFDLLALVAAVTNANGQIGTPAEGSDLANGTIACMAAITPPTLPIDFSGPLGGGGFDVRGGSTDPAGPILSHDGMSGIGIISETDWPTVLGQRALLYGQPNPSATFNEALVGTPWDWSSVPALPVINPGAVIGLCEENPGQLRVSVDHSSPQDEILNLVDPSFFLSCPNLVGQAGGRDGSFFAGRLVRLAASVFLPTPLHAAALNPGPVGGSPRGFSNFGAVDAGAINLSFTVQPPSSVQAGQPFALRLLATGNGGTPLPQVVMNIRLLRISGSGSLAGSTRKVTGVNGFETFGNLRVDQPGTYAIEASGALSGFSTVVIQSATFTVTP